MPRRRNKNWALRAHVVILEAILAAAALIEGIKYLLFLVRGG